jgi:hypothetical protein
MGQVQDSIDAATADWIARQAVFFVGTAPLSGAGHSADYVAKASDQAIHRYLQDNNRASIDGLPGLAPEASDAVRIDRSAGRNGPRRGGA